MYRTDLLTLALGFLSCLKLWDTDLAGLWILGSIHWAGGISGNKRGVLLTAVSST